MAEYNNLSALNEVLFEQLERINNADESTLEAEINRSKAIASLSGTILESGKLQLEAQKFVDSAMGADPHMPHLLGGA